MPNLATITGRLVLAEHQTAMAEYLTTVLNVPSNLAEAMTVQLADRLVGRMMEDLSITKPEAEYRLDVGMDFLLVLGKGRRSVPNETEDDLWHTFLLYSGEFEAFGMVTAGRQLRHFPNDVKGYNATEGKCGGSCGGNGGYCSSCGFNLVTIP